MFHLRCYLPFEMDAFFLRRVTFSEIYRQKMLYHIHHYVLLIVSCVKIRIIMIWISGYSGFLPLSKNMHVRLIVLRSECERVCGCLSRLSLCGPVMDWWPVQGVPRLSPNGRWDRLQPPRDPTDGLRGYRKWMDGWIYTPVLISRIEWPSPGPWDPLPCSNTPHSNQWIHTKHLETLMTSWWDDSLMWIRDKHSGQWFLRTRIRKYW